MFEKFRTLPATLVARTAKAGIKLVNPDRGSNMPGRIALRIAPRAFEALAGRLSHPIVLISGTNGKTTTTSFVAEIISVVSGRVTTNKAGANLKAGLVSTLLDGAGAPACLEVDEGALPGVLAECRPDFVALLNLTRDQLDRYGEIDTIASNWLDALSRQDSETTVLANADDPRIAYIASALRRLPKGPRVVFFGVESHHPGDTSSRPSPDAAACPVCGGDLSYSVCYPTGGGIYRCSACGFERPQPDYCATSYESLGLAGARVGLECPSGPIKLALPLSGLHNAYNALAATAAAVEAGLSNSVIEEVLARTKAAYGRSELIEIDGRRAYLLLSKNPQSLSQNLTLVAYEAERKPASPDAVLPVIFALNDRAADGRDVSWIWDVDFQGILPPDLHFIVCGDRAESAGLRLLYDGWDRSRIIVVRDPYHALCLALANAPSGWDVPVLATYTAMHTLRSGLVRRKMAAPIESPR